jgi:hypothetical protein
MKTCGIYCGILFGPKEELNPCHLLQNRTGGHNVKQNKPDIENTHTHTHTHIHKVGLNVE